MTFCGVSFDAHVNCFQLICVTFDLHVNCLGILTGWTTSEVFQCSLLSFRLLYCCFVGILVPRSLRRTTFRVCCNRYSAIMLPTHDELVLIAATNQPAVQAVEEAVGTPAVLGWSAQTPLSATLASVGIPSDAWNAFNEELGGDTRVRDTVNISTTDWENAIPPTHPVRMC